jgi:hypothetical protein
LLHLERGLWFPWDGDSEGVDPQVQPREAYRLLREVVHR